MGQNDLRYNCFELQARLWNELNSYVTTVIITKAEFDFRFTETLEVSNIQNAGAVVPTNEVCVWGLITVEQGHSFRVKT